MACKYKYNNGIGVHVGSVRCYLNNMRMNAYLNSRIIWRTTWRILDDTEMFETDEVFDNGASYVDWVYTVDGGDSDWVLPDQDGYLGNGNTDDSDTDDSDTDDSDTDDSDTDTEGEG